MDKTPQGGKDAGLLFEDTKTRKVCWQKNEVTCHVEYTVRKHGEEQMLLITSLSPLLFSPGPNNDWETQCTKMGFLPQMTMMMRLLPQMLFPKLDKRYSELLCYLSNLPDRLVSFSRAWLALIAARETFVLSFYLQTECLSNQFYLRIFLEDRSLCVCPIPVSICCILSLTEANQVNWSKKKIICNTK